MHRTLAPFTEAEPALLLVFCTNLAWRRSFFLSALLYTGLVERERGQFVDRGAAATLVISTKFSLCSGGQKNVLKISLNPGLGLIKPRKKGLNFAKNILEKGPKFRKKNREIRANRNLLGAAAGRCDWGLGERGWLLAVIGRGHGCFKCAQTRPKSPFGGPLGSQKTRSRVNWGQFGRNHRKGRFKYVKKRPHR